MEIPGYDRTFNVTCINFGRLESTIGYFSIADEGDLSDFSRLKCEWYNIPIIYCTAYELINAMFRVCHDDIGSQFIMPHDDTSLPSIKNSIPLSLYKSSKGVLVTDHTDFHVLFDAETIEELSIIADSRQSQTGGGRYIKRVDPIEYAQSLPTTAYDAFSYVPYMRPHPIGEEHSHLLTSTIGVIISIDSDILAYETKGTVTVHPHSREVYISTGTLQARINFPSVQEFTEALNTIALSRMDASSDAYCGAIQWKDGGTIRFSERLGESMISFTLPEPYSNRTGLGTDIYSISWELIPYLVIVLNAIGGHDA